MWTGNNWQQTDQSEFSYDSSVSGKTILGGDSPNKLLTETRINYSDGSVSDMRTQTYYYSPISSSASGK